MKPFKLKIITPEKVVCDEEVRSLIIFGELGYLGVLADHAPFATNINPGKIIFRKLSDETVTLRAKSRGFMEVSKNRATVLLDNSDGVA